MLVLTRELDQVVHIGDNIEVMIVDIKGGKVRLGITAPRVVPVHRGEVYRAIKKQNERMKLRIAELEAALLQLTRDQANFDEVNTTLKTTRASLKAETIHSLTYESPVA